MKQAKQTEKKNLTETFSYTLSFKKILLPSSDIRNEEVPQAVASNSLALF